MNSKTPSARVRRVESPSLVALGLAASLSALVLLALAIGALNRTYLQVDVEARDLLTGEVLWVRSDGTSEYPTFSSEFMLLEKRGGTVAINDTGVVVWRVDEMASWRIAEVGSVVLLQSGGSVAAVDVRSGEVRWRAEGWLDTAGERYAIVRSDQAAEVVDIASGDVVHFEDRVRDAATDGGTVAFLERRMLRIVRPASDLVREIPDDRWRRLLAVVDPIIIVDARASGTDADSGGSQRSLTGYDSRTGEVQWEATIPVFGTSVAVDGRSLRLGVGGSAKRIDTLTGEVLPADPTTPSTKLESLLSESAQSAIVDRFERVDNGSGTMVLSAGSNDPRDSATIAVDVQTGRVVWTLDGLQPIVANAHLAVLYQAASFHLVDSESGSEVGALPGRKWNAAVATDQLIAVLAKGELVVVDDTKRFRTIAGGLGSTARIEANSGDIIIVHTRNRTTGKRFLTAYDIAAGEELWTHQVPYGGSLELTEGTLEFVKGKKLIEIGLLDGERTDQRTEDRIEADEPLPQYTAAVFDRALSRLLWSHDLQYGERVEVIGDVVLIVDVTATYRDEQ